MWVGGVVSLITVQGFVCIVETPALMLAKRALHAHVYHCEGTSCGR